MTLRFLRWAGISFKLPSSRRKLLRTRRSYAPRSMSSANRARVVGVTHKGGERLQALGLQAEYAIIAIGPGAHQPDLGQARQVVGDGRGREVQQRRQLFDRVFMVCQQANKAQAGGIGQRLEKGEQLKISQLDIHHND